MPPLTSLTSGERLLVAAWRAMALGLGDCGLVRRGLIEAGGLAGPEAFHALTVFVQELGLKGRRRLALGRPGWPSLTADEQLLLDLFAAAQAEDYRRLDARLRDLLAAPPQPPFAAAACLVAQALDLGGLMLRPTAPSLATMTPEEIYFSGSGLATRS
jgi:hypothetical protein